MKLLMLDNYDSFTWNLVHYLEDILQLEVTVRRNNEFKAHEALAFDAIILSPGPGLPAESGNLMEVIRLCADKKPLLGVCLGLQAIVEHFGGRLSQLPAVMHGLQRNCTILEPSRIYKGVSSPFLAGRYHSWAADPHQLPACLKVTAQDEIGTIMSIEHHSLPIYAVQFHPESIMTPEGKKMLKNWLESII
jgi:anthranilate synthase component II